MKIIRVRLKIATVMVILLSSALIYGCKKTDSPIEEPIVKTETAVSNAKLITFLVNNMGVSKEEISFNAKTNEFIVKGVYKVNRDELIKTYNSSNEYKLNHHND